MTAAQVKIEAAATVKAWRENSITIIEWDLGKIKRQVERLFEQSCKGENDWGFILGDIKGSVEKTEESIASGDTADAAQCALWLGIQWGAFLSRLASTPVSPGASIKENGAPATIRRIKHWRTIPQRILLKKLKKKFPDRDEESLSRAIRDERKKAQKEHEK